MASKDELAEKAGVEDSKNISKAELEELVDAQEAAGPFGGEPTFEKHGKTITGVQALEDDDIPEAGR